MNDLFKTPEHIQSLLKYQLCAEFLFAVFRVTLSAYPLRSYATHVTLKNADKKASKMGILIITESLVGYTHPNF